MASKGNNHEDEGVVITTSTKSSSDKYYHCNYIYSVKKADQVSQLPTEHKVILRGYKNYRKWRRAINLALEPTKMLWVLHGKVPTMNDPSIEEWKTLNMFVLSWICGSISDDLGVKRSMERLKNAADVWRSLREFCFPPADYHILIKDIKDEIDSLKQDKRTLMDYKILFDARWVEYEMLHQKNNSTGGGHHNWEQERAKKFLRGLEKPFPSSLERVFDLVAQEDDEARKLLGVQPQTPDPTDKEDTKNDEKKRIIVLPESFHKHKLTLTSAAGEPYSCDGCKERGFGRSYRCENRDCRYVLHEECANAVLRRENPETHPFFGRKEFKFLAIPEGSPWICDACRMEVHGFVYHHRESSKDLYDTGLDLHPCCLKLRVKIPYHGDSSDAPIKALTLQRDVPEKCVKCKHHKVKGSRVGGWSYLTSDGDCFHVSCFKKLFLEKIQENYFSEKNITKKMQINTTAVENNSNRKDVKNRGGGSNSSILGKRKTMDVLANIASVVLKLIFSAIFGDPVSFVLTFVEALASAISN